MRVIPLNRCPIRRCLQNEVLLHSHSAHHHRDKREQKSYKRDIKFVCFMEKRLSSWLLPEQSVITLFLCAQIICALIFTGPRTYRPGHGCEYGEVCFRRLGPNFSYRHMRLRRCLCFERAGMPARHPGQIKIDRPGKKWAKHCNKLTQKLR